MNANDFRDSSIRHNIKKNKFKYDDHIISPAHSLMEFENGYHKTAWIVGSGPSLDKNIDLLPEVVERRGGSIFICDGSMTRCRKAGIKPNAVFTAETDFQGWTNRNTTELLLTEEDIEYYRDIPLITSYWANHKFLEQWKGPVFLYLDRDFRYSGYYEHFEAPRNLPDIYPRNSTVGFHAIAVARFLGFKSCVTLGMDYTTDGGKHHCDDFQLNGDWDVDMKSHYENHIKWFQTHYKGEFDICLTNSTEGGVMYRPAVNCYKHDLRDFLEMEVPVE
jgi:hypothetical protein